MRMPPRTLPVLLGLLAAAAATLPGAGATTLTQRATVSGSGEPDYTLAYLDFAGFDPRLGTLNSVTIQGTISIRETLTYQYATSTSQRVPVTLQFDLGIDGTPSAYLSQDTFGTATYPGSGGEVIDVSGFGALTDVLPSAYVGSTDLSNGFAGRIAATVTSPRFPSAVNGTVTAEASAIYDYTPTAVPEPSSLAVFAVAAAAQLRRRRRVR